MRRFRVFIVGALVLGARGPAVALAASSPTVQTGAATNVTTGVCFTQDHKKFSWYNPLRTAPGLDAQLQMLSPDFFQQLVDAEALDAGTAAALSGLAQGLQQTNIEFTNPDWVVAPVYTSKTWHLTSPRVVVDHQLTPDTMVDGSV